MKSKKRNKQQPPTIRTKGRTVGKSTGLFPVVGIGASAGGLEAIRELLQNLPVDTGMAFIIVQHLDPNHESLAPEILSRTTRMPVLEVKNGMRIEPNHIYMIPPNFDMAITHGVLSLLPLQTGTRGQPLVIDLFLQSLALDQKRRAIGVILSGVASDGTQGLRAIKAAGGLTIAQHPQSAKYSGMPKSAISSGFVDLILLPKDIAKELTRISKHPYVTSAYDARSVGEKLPSYANSDNATPAEPTAALQKIFTLLQTLSRVDFSNYKHLTIMRRIQRRMMVRRSKNIDDYAKYLLDHPDEVKTLYADILIHVTEFFRDPKAFKMLQERVFPQLIKNRKSNAPIRIWVPGCSTGEEAYSIAIVMTEFLNGANARYPIQIFATDISEQAIQKARNGFYSLGIETAVSKERIKRFFEKVDGGYKINKAIRDLCLFSRHDVTADPPFSKLDLVSCRNVLIYLANVLQKRVIPAFHYALNPGGFLFLGRSESLSGHTKLFALIDSKFKIYLKENVATPLILRAPGVHVPDHSLIPRTIHKARAGFDYLLDAERVALSRYAPSFVIINSEMEILQFHGRTAPCLEVLTGAPTNSLLKMARKELVYALRSTVRAAKEKNSPARFENLSFTEDGKRRIFNIEVVTVNPTDSPNQRNYVVFFEDASTLPGSVGPGKSQSGKLSEATNVPHHNQRLATTKKLEEELFALQQYQRVLAEQFEAAQEELTSANEELQSANEELQSTNEELETSKEELQSSNEELTTVNDELQNRNAELLILGSDLNNVLNNVEMPIVIVDRDQRIRKFTPRAEKVFNLISGDIGRPLSDIRPNFASDLENMASKAIKSLSSQESEIQLDKNLWMRLQVRPYRTIDDRIDGAVITLVDITALKLNLTESQVALKHATSLSEEAEAANATKDIFLAMLSHELRTPLSSILSWAQLIQQGKVDAANIKIGLQTIERSAKTQGQLIDDLLDVARIQSGKLSINFDDVDPREPVKLAVEAVRSLAENKHISIQSEMKLDSEIVWGDVDRLKQVIWNLLTNAIKFSLEGGRIEIKVAPSMASDKKCVSIKIIDHGKGIKSDFLPKIFERFSQADSSSVRFHGGLGLGLALAHDLTRLHHGTITAESEGPGKGATFTVNLPVKDVATPGTRKGSVKPNGEAAASQPIDLSGLCVMIVEDNPDTMNALSATLISFGAKTIRCTSARAALECFTDVKPDILISDIAMPGEDGYSLIQKIRKMGPDKNGNVPALSLTAYAKETDVKRAMAAGFNAHMAKPFDTLSLAAAVLKLSKRQK